MALVTSIMRAQQIMLAEVERVLKPFGLTFARYEVLMLLHFSRRGALPVGKIGERLQVHPASVTNAVARLEADGFVTRTPNPSDRRGVLAQVTSEGRTRALSATERLNAEVFQRVGELTGEAPSPLFEQLRELRRSFDEFI
jgi:DNA-binding MarR family transcriptional regulator